MSVISKLAGKGKEVQLGDVTIIVKPLTVNDMDLMMDLSKEGTEEQIVAMKKLINKVLKQAVPDATDDEINNVSVEHLTSIMNVISELNGVDMKQGEAELLAKMKDR